MDTKVQYVVLNQVNGMVGAPSHSYQGAVKQITTILANKYSKGHQGPFTVYKSIEKLEIEHIAVNLKKTPVYEPEASKPEPGYQPEGFGAQKTLVEYAREGGPMPHAPAGFGSDFGTEF